MLPDSDRCVPSPRRRRTTGRAALLTALLALPAGLGLAAGGDEAPPKEQKEKATKPDFPPLAEVTKGMTKKAGKFWSLWIDEKKNALLAEIPSGQLRKPFLLATTVSGGSYYTGWQWQDFLLKWERRDKKLLLIVPNVRYKAKKGQPIDESVERTYADSYLFSVPIVSMSGSNPVIDLGKMLMGKADKFFGSVARGVDASIGRVVKAKPFERNVEIAVELPPSGGGSMLTFHYSFATIPKTGYKPRIADDRVGYFLTAVKDFSKSWRERTRFDRYINRWHLEKADPSLDLSPPKEPIVFYIEKTVPVRYRRWVHDGIAEWNKAFEKVGFLNAVVVRQQTDTQFTDLDPEDARYNFFRWITSETPFAMGPSRVNPMTGEILDADIIFDDSMVRWTLNEHRLYLESALEEALEPAQAAFLREHPEHNPLRHLPESLRWPERSRVARAAAFPAKNEGPGLDLPLTLGEAHREQCQIGEGMSRQMRLAFLALAGVVGEEDKDKNEADKDEDEETGAGEDDAEKQAAQKKQAEWPEEFLGPILKETVMHEVGHTLGLRHNFKASTWKTLEEINEAEGSCEVTTGSVMDYNPANIVADRSRQGPYITSTIGPYDYWAIEYGYKPIQGDEKKELAKIASRVSEEGLAYGTDEDVWGADPLINRWDISSDPMAFTRSRMDLVNSLWDDVLTRIVEEGESYHPARSAFTTLLFEYAMSGIFAANFIGGSYMHRDHKGDPGERPPFEAVAGAKQREALELITSEILSDKAFRFDPNLLAHLAAGRFAHWDSDEFDDDIEVPIYDLIQSAQSMVLFSVLNGTTLQRVYDNEALAAEDEDALTLPEVFDGLTQAIFSELDGIENRSEPATPRRPLISNVRRNLQREYVSMLIDLSLSDGWGWAPRAAETLSWDELRRLGGRIQKVLGDRGGSALDAYTRSHLAETRTRIEKALEASYQLGR